MHAGILLAVTLAATPPSKCVIAVAPVGDVSRERIDVVAPAIRDVFGCAVEIAPPIPLPSAAWSAERRQHLSTAILEVLARSKRPEWERLLGVADVDLYVPQLNFVFGEGDSRRGVAVFSLARLGGPGAPFRRRAATEAVHDSRAHLRPLALRRSALRHVVLEHAVRDRSEGDRILRPSFPGARPLPSASVGSRGRSASTHALSFE